MIRQIIIPTEKEITLRIPDDMIGKPTEILLFSIPDGEADAQPIVEDVPNRDTFLSYLQHSGFGIQHQPTASQGQNEEDPVD